MSTRSKWNKSIIILLLPALLCCIYASAQVVSGRMELNLQSPLSEPYKTQSLGEKGILLFRKVITIQGTGLEAIGVDTTLHQIWKVVIPSDENFMLLRQSVLGNRVYLLTRAMTSSAAHFKIVSINIHNGEFHWYPILNLIQFTPREFVVTQEAFLIGGSFNHRAVVLYSGIRLINNMLLPGLPNEPGELNQLGECYDGTIDVVIAGKNQENESCLWIRNYNAQGLLLKAILVEPGPRKKLLFGQTIKLSGDERVVAGGYGRFNEFARGIFLSRITQEGEYQINYYNFGDLRNFFTYMRPRQVRRIKERVERRKAKGKIIHLSTRLLMHPLVLFRGQFVILLEAFQPSYRYSSYGTGFGYSDPYRNILVFDGYHYSHTFAVGFNSDGKMIWDNSLEMNDIKSFQLQPFAQLNPGTNRSALLYLNQHNIRSRIFHQDEVLEPQNQIGPEDGNNQIHISYVESSKLENWYDKHLYVSGVQYVKNKFPADSPVRKVFQITRITCP